jgi:hypothetical protein
VDIKDSYLTIAYKAGYIHVCENRTTGETEITTTIGYETNYHKTIIGAKRYITMIGHYKPPLNSVK